MRPIRTWSKHYRSVIFRQVEFAPWLARIASSLANFSVEPEPGIVVTSTSDVQGNVNLIVSGGTAGRRYRIGVTGFAADDGLREYVEVAIRVNGQPLAGASEGAYAAELILSNVVASGAGQARAGSLWVYQLKVVSETAGASATFQVRVGADSDCDLPFGAPVTVTCASTPSAVDGKYHGAAELDGDQPWSYHAADVTAINGTNTVASVVGNGT